MGIEEVTVSTGVVLRIKDVPLFSFDAIRKKLAKDEPQVPMCYIEEKAREEPNPNDPDYIKLHEEWELDLASRMIDAAFILGTEIETLPEGFPQPEDQSWARKCEIAGIDIPGVDDVESRYLAWVKHCAAPTVNDITELFTKCSRSAGVTEVDAAEAAASFPSRAERRTNRKVPS